MDSSDSDDDRHSAYPSAARHPAHSTPDQSGPQSHYGAQAQQSAGTLFSSLKGGAFSIMRNVKDASTKVMETVSACVYLPSTITNFVPVECYNMGPFILLSYVNHCFKFESNISDGSKSLETLYINARQTRRVILPII